MPLINAVQWRDASEDELAQRFPEVSLRYGSQLTVMENQWGVFFKDGKSLDVFEPGRHTITSKNIPILIDLVKGLGLIGDIFECEVVFVNKSQARVNFGGRAYSAPSGQIQYQAEIGFYGYMIIKVDDPKKFVTEFFGNRQASDTDDVSRFIRGFAMERVMDSFAEHDIFSLVRARAARWWWRSCRSRLGCRSWNISRTKYDECKHSSSVPKSQNMSILWS